MTFSNTIAPHGETNKDTKNNVASKIGERDITIKTNSNLNNINEIPLRTQLVTKKGSKIVKGKG